MKNIISLLLSLLISSTAFAQSDISYDLPLAPGKLLAARTADNSADVGILGLDASDNTRIVAKTGKVVNFPGNVTVTGTLGATGNSTVTGTLGVTGKVTASAGVSYPAALLESVAAGTGSQGDGPLTAGKFIHVVTGFDETKVATLPACAAANIGEIHFILNSVTNKFSKIFPATGGTINALSANAAYTHGVTGQGGKVLMCFCQAANQWYCA